MQIIDLLDKIDMIKNADKNLAFVEHIGGDRPDLASGIIHGISCLLGLGLCIYGKRVTWQLFGR